VCTATKKGTNAVGTHARGNAKIAAVGEPADQQEAGPGFRAIENGGVARPPHRRDREQTHRADKDGHRR